MLRLAGAQPSASKQVAAEVEDTPRCHVHARSQGWSVLFFHRTSSTWQEEFLQAATDLEVEAKSHLVPEAELSIARASLDVCIGG